MMHKAWCSTEEVPYYFSRSSIKFEGHMDRKIDDLNPILSKITRLVVAVNSSDLPCFMPDDKGSFSLLIVCLSDMKPIPKTRWT